MKYLGLDLGSRTLGIAVSDVSGKFAFGYGVLHHNEEYDRLVNDIKNIVSELSIEAIVLGFPKNMNNTIGPKGELSLSFQKKLEEAVSLLIYLQDERLSTKTAHDVLIAGNMSRKKRKKVVDSVAAVVILQTFLDRSVKNG